MPGVNNGALLYETRPLENIIPMLIWFKSNTKKQTNNEDMLAVFSLSTCISESFFVLAIPLLAYVECCATQFVSCRLPKQNIGSWSVSLLIIATLQVLGLLFSGACILVKIGVIVYCVSTNLGAIGSLYYSKSFCQCKKCLGLKDVKLIYKSERYSITERNVVTSMNLQEWFKFSLAEGTRLAIQIRNGEIIYEFNRQNWCVQLHEGEYIIRDITYNVNPVVSSSIAQTECYTLPSNEKMEITSAEKKLECTIMNID